MAHDPLCKYAKTPKEVEWHLCACCAWVKEIRAEERWATVESVIYIASQYGVESDLVQLLSRLYEAPEAQMDAEARHELHQLAQEMGMIP